MTRWLAVFLVIWAAPAFALDDTPQNRAQEADRYLAAVPTKELMEDMMTKMAKGMPDDQRSQFLDMMTKRLDMTAIRKAQRDAMIKVFSADELAALAEFNAQPAAKSAMRKMGDYMAEMMPVVMGEVMKAQAAAARELPQQPKN